jgi:glycosyltransferase involved in cell wall biosynthesis
MGSILAVKVLICLNTAWNLVNFRSGLIKALVAQGYEVVAVAPPDEFVNQLSALGCRFVPLPMANGGTNPLHDGLLLWRFWRLLKQERPDVFLGYTVKPNVYGSLAAHWLGIPVINNVAGLGAVFISGGWLVKVVRSLYRLALGRSTKVFFQNPDDRAMFVEGGLVRGELTELLPGSGVDLVRFAPPVLPLQVKLDYPASSADKECHGADPTRHNDLTKFRFLLIARMLRDKGVCEYVEAARQLRKRWPNVEFCLLGFLDVQNPAAIARSDMDAWVAEGVVNYLGASDDVRAQIAMAHCIVLPSYREGTPRSLLEAAAMARPIITTNTVGCREVVDDGINGYLCKVRDAKDLADKMSQMLQLSCAQRSEMGLRGRAKMEAEFDEKIVIEKYLAAVREAVGNSGL